MSSTTDLGSTHRISVAVKCLPTTPIDIYRNSIWAGSGYVRNGRIVDCYATQLGRDGMETEAIYDAIERAIASGQSSLCWSLEGRLSFTWRLGDNGY